MSEADIKHKDGVPWHQAPVPPADHECWHQTTGWIGVNQWARCPCGAIADALDLKVYLEVYGDLPLDTRKRYGTTVDRGIWMERNSRRRDDRLTDARPTTSRRPFWRRAVEWVGTQEGT
jgi:hypothetical protein